MAEHLQTIEVSAAPIESHARDEFLSPDVSLMILTWVTFFSLLAILYRFAWKPILSGLEEREEKIRRALEDAQKATEELAKIHLTRQKILAEADEKAREIVAQSRKAALEAARIIEQKTKDEAQIQLANLQFEIKAARQKAEASLREESARLIVALASKIIQEDLDTPKNRQFVDRLMKEI